MLYGMGMLEMGMTFSYTQLVLDNEIANMVNRSVRGVDINDSTLAVDVIRKVGGGVGKNFLREKHTREYMRSEQQTSVIFDRMSYGKWLSAGAEDATARAREKARDIFYNHKPEPLDEAILKELDRIAGPK